MTEELVKSKDRWTIWTLIAKKCELVKVQVEPAGNGRNALFFYFSGQLAHEIYDLRMRGKPIEVDVRDMETAELVFKHHLNSMPLNGT